MNTQDNIPLVSYRTNIFGRFEVYDLETTDSLATGSDLGKARKLVAAIHDERDTYLRLRDIHFIDARAWVLHTVIPSLFH